MLDFHHAVLHTVLFPYRKHFSSFNFLLQTHLFLTLPGAHYPRLSHTGGVTQNWGRRARGTAGFRSFRPWFYPFLFALVFSTKFFIAQLKTLLKSGKTAQICGGGMSEPRVHLVCQLLGVGGGGWKPSPIACVCTSKLHTRRAQVQAQGTGTHAVVLAWATVPARAASGHIQPPNALRIPSPPPGYQENLPWEETLKIRQLFFIVVLHLWGRDLIIAFMQKEVTTVISWAWPKLLGANNK